MASFAEKFIIPSRGISSSCKILILGDSGVGKSAYMERMTTGQFLDNVPNANRVFFLSTFSKGKKTKMTITFLDYCPSSSDQDITTAISQADALILMFDTCNLASFNNLPIWYNKFVQQKPYAPIVLVGNKCDLRTQQVGTIDKVELLEATQRLYKYYDLSVRSNYNFEKPILRILRELGSDENLRLIETN